MQLTQVKLDYDVMNQLGMTAEDHEIEFDAKGTAHVMVRGSEGELKRDTPLSLIKDKVTINNDNAEMLEEIDNLKEMNKVMRRTRKIMYAVVAILAVIAFFVLKGF